MTSRALIGFLIVAMTTGLVMACSQAQPSVEKAPPSKAMISVTAVKSKRDPRAGVFKPNLQEVWFEGSEEPQVFCGDGKAIPTGERLTVFFYRVKGGPDNSACLKAVAVVKGEAEWVDGQAVTHAELKKRQEEAEHYEKGFFTSPDRQLTFAWRKPRPVGPPCKDLSGTPYDVLARYERRSCSIAIRYEDSGHVLLLNWTVIGNNIAMGTDEQGPAPRVGDVVDIIYKIHGSQYVISGTPTTLSSTKLPESGLPSKIVKTVRVIPLLYTEAERTMAADWKSAEPAGNPCPDVSGPPLSVAKRLSKEGCTIAIYSCGEITLTNWKVAGDLEVTTQDREANFTGRDLVLYLKEKYPGFFRQRAC